MSTTIELGIGLTHIILEIVRKDFLLKINILFEAHFFQKGFATRLMELLLISCTQDHHLQDFVLF